jgi:hypothetical protein
MDQISHEHQPTFCERVRDASSIWKLLILGEILIVFGFASLTGSMIGFVSCAVILTGASFVLNAIIIACIKYG